VAIEIMQYLKKGGTIVWNYSMEGVKLLFVFSRDSQEYCKCMVKLRRGLNIAKLLYGKGNQ
jgi:hypothetical protein